MVQRCIALERGGRGWRRIGRRKNKLWEIYYLKSICNFLLKDKLRETEVEGGRGTKRSDLRKIKGKCGKVVLVVREGLW